MLDFETMNNVGTETMETVGAADAVENVNVDVAAAAAPARNPLFTPKGVLGVVGITIAAGLACEILDELVFQPFIIEPLHRMRVERDMKRVEKLKEELNAKIDGTNVKKEDVDVVDKNGKKVNK